MMPSASSSAVGRVRQLQTGWTGTVALLPLLFRGVNAKALLRRGGVVAAEGPPRQ